MPQTIVPGAEVRTTLTLNAGPTVHEYVGRVPLPTVISKSPVWLLGPVESSEHAAEHAATKKMLSIARDRFHIMIIPP